MSSVPAPRGYALLPGRVVTRLHPPWVISDILGAGLSGRQTRTEAGQQHSEALSRARKGSEQTFHMDPKPYHINLTSI